MQTVQTEYSSPSQAEPGELRLCRAILTDAIDTLNLRPDDHPRHRHLYYQTTQWFLGQDPNPSCFFTYEVVCQMLGLECPARIRAIIFKRAKVKEKRRDRGSGSLSKHGQTWWMYYSVRQERVAANTHCESRVSALKVMREAIEAAQFPRRGRPRKLRAPEAPLQQAV